jgi:hypothetical protein
MSFATQERPLPVPKTIDFKREPYSDSLIKEMKPLWEEHYEELALHKDFPLSPNLGIYQKCSEIGVLRLFTAREDKKLVGYQIFFVHPHSHFSGAIAAIQDLLFISSPMRRGLIGYQFLKWCDQELTDDGVNLVYQHVKKTHNYGPLLQRLGYAEHDIVYSRRLG